MAMGRGQKGEGVSEGITPAATVGQRTDPLGDHIMIIASIAPNLEEESDFPLTEIDTASINSLVRQGSITI